MGLEPAVLDEVVRRILAVARPERIVLFGSAARGEMTPDSDIDLLILDKDAAGRGQRAKYLAVRRALRGLGYPFDIIFMPPSSFEAGKDVIGGVAYPASHEGRVLYEAA